MTPLSLVGFPRYRALVKRVYHCLGHDADRYRAYRISLSHPLTSTQITMAFSEPVPPGI